MLLYAYAIGVRSSCQIERRLTEDLAFRVLAANQTPDHVTIARFRVRHEQALAGFLVQSLRLCAAAGMVRIGSVALDGIKLAGNAAEKANRTHEQLEGEVAEILRQAAATDQRDDREHGNGRGDELPAALASRAGRLARLRVAKAQLEAEAAWRERRYRQRVAELAAAARAKGKQPRAHKPTASRSDGLRAAMTAKLQSNDGKARYAKRKETVEPVFGQIRRRPRRAAFMGRGLRACQAEWKPGQVGGRSRQGQHAMRWRAGGCLMDWSRLAVASTPFAPACRQQQTRCGGHSPLAARGRARPVRA